jgi:two-component system CheB/CheR fusion protein
MANDENRAEEAGGSQTESPLPTIVAVGASAGGIRALQALFAALPDNTGAAFVIVVHLDPEHRSDLPRILGSRTSLPVVEVTDQERLEGDRIYIIPPDRQLEMADHSVSLREFSEPRGRRLPIDTFFRSVADHLGDGVAIILSGAGSDGSIGIRAVKETGGIILVQEPSEAEYSSVPRNAIATGVVDFILPIADIANRLIDILRLKKERAESAPPPVDEEVLRRVLAHLRVRTGHDFSKYKRSTILRRISRRMQVTRTSDLADYYEVLRENARRPSRSSPTC